MLSVTHAFADTCIVYVRIDRSSHCVSRPYKLHQLWKMLLF